jgi:ankyrin repeat domain-containing protein 50
MQDYKMEGDHLLHSFHKLWGILNKATFDLKAGEVICILDALDECAEVERYQIIDTLSTFYKQSQSGSQLKFLVTSRPYSDIERKFANLVRYFPTIRLYGERESEAIGREINIVIRSKVLELGQLLELNDSEQSVLRDEVLAMEQRTYLWVTLIFRILHDELDPTEDRLKDIINTVPQTVDQAYEAILSRIKDKRKAKKLFHLIVAATRPLTLSEINIALAIEDHHQSYKDLCLSNHARFENTLRNLCGLFINIIDQKVYLIHQTAKEFLVAKNEAYQDVWKNSLDHVGSELLMARICITYLLFTDFNTEINTGDGIDVDTGDGIDVDDIESNAADAGSDSNNEFHEIEPHGPSFQLTESHGYLNYAAKFWSSHFRQAQSRATREFLQSVAEICDIQSPRFHVWGRIFWRTIPPWSSYSFTSTTLVASYLGLETVVKLQLEQGTINLDSKNSNSGQTPLSYAAGNGYEGIVKLLLEAKADVDAEDDSGRMPLSYAAENGYEGIVKLLLEVKADVNSKYNFDRTPLSYAATIRR